MTARSAIGPINVAPASVRRAVASPALQGAAAWVPAPWTSAGTSAGAMPDPPPRVSASGAPPTEPPRFKETGALPPPPVPDTDAGAALHSAGTADAATPTAGA